MTEMVLNERARAEKELEELTLGAYPAETLSRVARYYAGEGYGYKDICRLLEDFMIKCDPNLNLAEWERFIERQARVAFKYPLVDIDGVCITRNEIKRIQEINGLMLQRLMFTMLCFAKYGNAANSNNNNWVNKKDKIIFHCANIITTTRRQSLLINDLWTMGYIEFSNRIDNVNINVKIVDNSSPCELFITDFRSLGNQYRRYCGEPYVECQCCGIVIKNKNGKQKYCKDCAKEVNKQRAALRYRDDDNYVSSEQL